MCLTTRLGPNSDPSPMCLTTRLGPSSDPSPMCLTTRLGPNSDLVLPCTACSFEVQGLADVMETGTHRHIERDSDSEQHVRSGCIAL